MIVRIGGAGGTGGGVISFPLGLNVLAGKGPHYFEAGFTATFLTDAIFRAHLADAAGAVGGGDALAAVGPAARDGGAVPRTVAFG